MTNQRADRGYGPSSVAQPFAVLTTPLPTSKFKDKLSRRLPHPEDAGPQTHWRKIGKLDWNNLGGHEPARFRVVGQVLDAPERLREVVEALAERRDDVAAPAQILGAPR